MEKVALEEVFLPEPQVFPITSIIPLVVYSSSSLYYSHQKDKWAKCGNLYFIVVSPYTLEHLRYYLFFFGLLVQVYLCKLGVICFPHWGQKYPL
jgi:hypothetical protein